MYAIPLNVLEESLMANVFRLSDKDLLSSMSINEGVSGSLKSYYELVHRDGLLAWGECLLRKKRPWEYRRRNVFF